jgi:hypothetical protein
MTSGALLGLILGLFLVLWLTTDFILFLIGKQTFSQWVIRHARKRLFFTLIALFLIIGTATVLIWHFELVPILIGHIYGTSI